MDNLHAGDVFVRRDLTDSEQHLAVISVISVSVHDSGVHVAYRYTKYVGNVSTKSICIYTSLSSFTEQVAGFVQNAVSKMPDADVPV